MISDELLKEIINIIDILDFGIYGIFIVVSFLLVVHHIKIYTDQVC